MIKITIKEVHILKELIDKLGEQHTLSLSEWTQLISGRDDDTASYLYVQATKARRAVYGDRIFLRGLIEYTNYCCLDCSYCGIRKSNTGVQRYRLGADEILLSCAQGYELGFRSFVLQGGSDPFYDTQRLSALIKIIKTQFPDCAVSLVSAACMSIDDLCELKRAGLDRYLLRFESSDSTYYRELHPAGPAFGEREHGIEDAMRAGFQTGTGFMTGTPGQTANHLAQNMMYLSQIRPQMVSIGPFVPQKNTPFAKSKSGSAELTLFMLGLTRVMMPDVLLSASGSFDKICKNSRELAVMAGANVLMPNLSPLNAGSRYLLYDNKVVTGEQALRSIARLRASLESEGCFAVVDRGDHIPLQKI